ncbi:pyruvate phosphate dikinase [Erysipelothrix larvae]|uniref:Pyruvate, phosphate dikinase n=1 Tax=Erysipelothrix larvae TaxID=1514105 RepID=A0A0X8GYY4_9FIRM|nr:pyruvate, phosphate dikinase [Erysipelothrix larvae]AMC92992.1 pyruvate phosphate dikinase [Erysipelothrix larvae]
MQYVYLFSEGNASMRETLGGKGANLAEMTNLGLPVPQGFTVSTDACNLYYEHGEVLSEDVKSEIFDKLKKLEEITGKKFGGNDNPLLVSVRSGSRASMPGMMDTVLNLGINEEVLHAIEKVDPKLAYDSYRRFITMFGEVVMGVEKTYFDNALNHIMKAHNYESDHDLTVDALKEVVNSFKSVYKEHTGKHFPTDPNEQLLLAVEAVFRSWNNPRAIYYRKMNDIPMSWGTAVNIQEMVFGNMGEGCATGVAFSRNPATGEKKLYGEFLYNAQGEDVVAGTHTPLQIVKLKEEMPDAYAQFEETAQKLEAHYHDMQDMEFTIERGKLFMLQTRNGKRTAQAAVRIAVDMLHEGLITKQEAVDSLDLKIIDGLLHPQFDADRLKKTEPIATGLPASPGAASGVIALDAASAVEYCDKGRDVILVRLETSPEDIEGMNVSKGILTARGGMTSHAAVVGRGMGKAAIVGCSEIQVDDTGVTIQGKHYNEGEYISIDGSTGHVYPGLLKTEQASIKEDFKEILELSDELAPIQVYANADSPQDVARAIEFGAKGVGLVRTEHMFFEASRIRAVREMILSTTQGQREVALDKILPMQREDFEGIFRVLEGRSATIRFLDPPLHEFMPTTTQDIEELAVVMNRSTTELREVIRRLHEYNPMMGHRGCRLAITYPEISMMQTRAVIEAAINVSKETGKNVKPEIMIPLVGDVKEFTFLASKVRETADALIKDSGLDLKYTVGTMIELPRACVLADEIAQQADFFSFGTNDLTQMTYGFSRDDAGTFLKDYYSLGIYDKDPFATVDQLGVGSLIKMAVEKGRATNPNLKIGVCGEHGGDPASIAFFKSVGVDYVSCSPYRVPVARIAAARDE